MTRNRVLLIAGAALTLVALVAAVAVVATLRVVGGGAGGGGDPGGGGGGEAGAAQPQAVPVADMTGDWAFRVNFEGDDPRQEIPETAVVFRLHLYQDGSGYLYADEEGPGWLGGEEEQRHWVEVRSGENSVVRPDGAAGLQVSGDGTDSSDDRYGFVLDGEMNESRDRVEGDAEGRVHVDAGDSVSSATGRATSFEAWREEF